MRKVSRLAVVVLIVLVISHVVTLRLPVRAGSGPAGENGDANGDGVLDLSDPIYILRYLFQEGPGPVACADSPEVIARVATLETEMAGLRAAVQELQNPCEERSERFTDNSDGTVTDGCTGLMWMRGNEDLSEDGRFDNDSLSWDAANAYCAALSVGGHSGWRLPSLHELDDLRATRMDVSPWAPPGTPFEVYPAAHWTATRHPHPDLSEAVWVVEFRNNGYFLQSRHSACLVLAVRALDAP